MFPTRRGTFKVNRHTILVMHYGQFYALKVPEIIKSQYILILIESKDKNESKNV